MFTFKRIGSRLARQSEIPFAKRIDQDQFSNAQLCRRSAGDTNFQLFQDLAADKFNAFANIQGHIRYQAPSIVSSQLKLILKKLNFPTFKAEVLIVLRKSEELNWASCLTRTPTSIDGNGSHQLFSTRVSALLTMQPSPRLCVLVQRKNCWMKETYTYQAVAPAA